MVVAAVVSALVAGGALVAAAVVRDRGETAATPTSSPAPTTSGVGLDGCLVKPCQVLATVPIGGTVVELVADAGARSGRLRIGGAGSSDVIEVTITDHGATLTPESLQCVSGTLAACVVRGQVTGGNTEAQVVVGRTGKWSDRGTPYVSDAGYLALADLMPDVGPEIVAVQHRCDRATTADCSATKVFAEVYSLVGAKLGCTRTYTRLDSMPGYPNVDLADAALDPC